MMVYNICSSQSGQRTIIINVGWQFLILNITNLFLGVVKDNELYG